MVQSSRDMRSRTVPTITTTSEAAIWARIIEPEKNGLSSTAARSLLELRFSEWDLAHMNELAQKNQDGLLNDAERQELESYVKVGDVLSLLHLKARRSLQH
jgi:hypothetical protein